eukprot:TRINITY_DN5426_c0_g1_i2.p1 TRINITY_DN5426_c0_g1~~TRINITY_DN5426_c0_g1_i2.p1  ORF type:complete len:376 (-),score=85.63 TRINITY_DN5426_c0_g1_i2:49-1176(-)
MAEGYRLKKIRFNDREVMICLQNVNGPCPLLAIANILLLRGAISIHSDYSQISSEDLMALLGDYLFKNRPKFTNADEEANYNKNIQDTVAMFPKLQVGLDVNVKFKNIRDFEFTNECLIFDLMNVSLVHGWLVDPSDKNNFEVISNLSYNQAVEKLVSVSSPAVKKRSGSASDNTSNVNNNDNVNTEQSPSQDVMRDVNTIRHWLEETASQLTFHGIIQLHQDLQDEQLCVFFRNNHFSTLYRHKDKLYLLVTDQGYLRERGIVWEVLDQISGDTTFVDDDYNLFQPKSGMFIDETMPITDDHIDPALLSEDPTTQLSTDLQVALQLHHEMNESPPKKKKSSGKPQQQQEQHKKKSSKKKKTSDSDSDSGGCIVS